MKTFRNPETIHPPLGAYTHQIEVTEPSKWLVLSGQVGQYKDGSIPEDPIEQIKVALENISHNLRAANMKVSDVVKLTFYLVGEFETDRRREVVKNWMEGHQPAMTLLYVAALAAPIYKVEIDAWACVDAN